ncbi:hypothetical protein HY970_03410 [Candidatus Kaiserbacteria bacterium]|nr:hypothetical protein [Candidatus Kaiserbacteria bacterium]
MAKRHRRSPRSWLDFLLPRRRSERRKVEFLGGAAVSLVVLIALTTFVAASAQRTLLGNPNVAAVVSSVLVDLLNGDRASQQLGTLNVNAKLAAAAQMKANDMATKGYFSHTSPEGHDSWYWFKQAGYNFEYAGENLAVDFSESADVERAWMQSPTHRANILQSHFTEIGIATAVGTYQGRSTVFAVQMFGSPASAGAAAFAHSTTEPTNPKTIAIATPKPSNPEPRAVLGESAPQSAESPAKQAPVNVVAKEAPSWSYPLSSPKETMKYIYIALAILILIALAIDTGLEMHWHHARRAAAAGFLLVLLCGLFFTANSFIFTDPIVAQSGSQTASAALGR